MGKNVKLDNLAIFYISIKNKMGAENADDFTVSKNIEGVRMKARATGDFRYVNLNLDANLKKYGAKKKKSSTTDSGTTTPSESTDKSDSGSGSTTNPGSDSGEVGL